MRGWIARLALKADVPSLSSSSFDPDIGSLRQFWGPDVHGPSPAETRHSDVFWCGNHGVGIIILDRLNPPHPLEPDQAWQFRPVLKLSTQTNFFEQPPAPGCST